MKKNRTKIDEYKDLMKKEYIRESAVHAVMEQCTNIICQQDNKRASYFEFLFDQFKFMKKRWWVLQGGVLLLLWTILGDMDTGDSTARVMGAVSVIFSILIIPEIWKNRICSAVEIEKTAFYSLRQICSARTLLFAAVDLAMLTTFFGVSAYTLQIPLYRIILDFLIPFNVSCCICFRLLYSKWNDMEYVAVFLSIVCIFIWSLIVSSDFIYQKISIPVWAGLLTISFVYLVYCIYKSNHSCEICWKEKVNGTTI